MIAAAWSSCNRATLSSSSRPSSRTTVVNRLFCGRARTRPCWLRVCARRMKVRQRRRWDRSPSRSRVAMIPAGPAYAPNACGTIVQNSAAWPAFTPVVLPPSRTRTVPDRTVNQSRRGCTGRSPSSRTGGSWVRQILATFSPWGPWSRDSSHVAIAGLRRPGPSRVRQGGPTSPSTSSLR